jgi:hypothetical protein
MTKIGTIFKFAAPDGWTEFRDGNRYVFHGPKHEELIVSASLVQGIGPTNNLAAVQRQLFENAELSVNKAATHPDLKITQPFQKEAQTLNVECWNLLANTREGDTLFYQAVFRDARGILIATLEAPNTTHSINAFERFVKSVDVISESHE